MSRKMILREEKSKKVVDRFHLIGAIVVAVLLIATLVLYNVPVFKAVTTENKVVDPDPAAIWTIHVNGNGNFSFVNGDSVINLNQNGDKDFSLTTAPSQDPEGKTQDWNIRECSKQDMTFFVVNRAASKAFLSMQDGKLSVVYAEDKPADGCAMQFYLMGKGEEVKTAEPEEEDTVNEEALEGEETEPVEETEDPDLVQEDEVADVIDLEHFVLRTDLREGEQAILYSPTAKLAVTADGFAGAPIKIISEVEHDQYSLRGVLKQQKVDALFIVLIIATVLLLVLSFLPVFTRRFESMKAHVLIIALAIVHIFMMVLLYLIFKTNICAYVMTVPSVAILGFLALLLPIAAIVVELIVKKRCYVEP